MLSFNRETAPESYIKSLDPRHLYLGHTGTSIREYIEKARGYSELFSIPVEVEADHVSIMGSVERALKKIAGVPVEEPLSETDIQFSLNYIEEEFKEVAKVGGVDFITIDTCELIDYSIDKLDDNKVLALYESSVEQDVRRELERNYVDKTFSFLSTDRHITVRFKRVDVARVVLKYMRSLEYAVKVYELAKKYIRSPFGVEVAFDETPHKSGVKDVVFYVLELKRRGIDVDFLAPNIGYKKREDYDKDLRELYEDLRNFATVLGSLGVYISIHSGSGHNPYSDKGFGVWRTVGAATNGNVKYKMSGVLIQLLLEVMHRMPPGSKPRRLYEEIYQVVIDHLRKVVENKGTLYSRELETLLEKYEKQNQVYNPRADVFRHYFYIFQAIRDSQGNRTYRDALLQLYSEDQELRKTYEREVGELIERLAASLNYVGNLIRRKAIVIA